LLIVGILTQGIPEFCLCCYHLPDFSNWKNHDAFEKAFARLEKDLRTSIL